MEKNVDGRALVTLKKILTPIDRTGYKEKHGGGGPGGRAQRHTVGRHRIPRPISLLDHVKSRKRQEFAK
jgi:hypothetical protein